MYSDNFFHETDDTRANTRAFMFDQIITRIEDSGGEITLDEESPLFAEIGFQDLEIGEERLVEFELAGNEFQLTRKTEHKQITGSGSHKSLQDLDSPRIKIVLKKKSPQTGDWQIVDLDAMF